MLSKKHTLYNKKDCFLILNYFCDSSVVTCDAPGKVAHGKSLWDSEGDPKYGDVIHYVCNEGYTLVGKDNIVCGETGEYDSQPPECEGKHSPSMCLTCYSTDYCLH